MAGRKALQWRWSGRDLRQRWVLVATIALILGIGTGIYASLLGTSVWRRQSNDASFAATRVHDLRVALAEGNLIDEGRLAAAARAVLGDGAVGAAEERLVWRTQVEVPGRSSDDEAFVFVPGQLVGGPVPATVDVPWLRTGTVPSVGSLGVLLEDGFARARRLPSTGDLVLSGERRVRWTGTALLPEHLTGGSGDVNTGLSMLDPGAFALLTTPLADAQALVGQPGQVNDLVLRLASGTDRLAARDRLEAGLATALPGVGARVTTTEDIPAYRQLYEDIDNDAQVWRLIALLILGGASFAAFNLIHRVVEAQRREIGIGMALGVPRRELAVRPLLLGVQVAVLGVLLGIGIGLVVNQLMENMFRSVLPLPVWRTPFQSGTFLQAAALGVLLPFVATVIPVVRAVRVEPITAIRTGRFATGQSGWARLGTHLRHPRRSTAQYAIRNLLRSPRRALLTAFAIAASITVLVSIVGMLDSITRTIDRADAALTYEGGDRVNVQLESFVPESSTVVDAVRSSPAVADVTTGLLLPGRLEEMAGDAAFDVVVAVLPFASAPWAPAVTAGQPPSGDGVLLAEKAARDLGVDVGDSVRFEHPRRDGLGYRMVTTTVRVAGVHGIPARPYVFLDTSQAGLFELAGITNTLQVIPAPGTSAAGAQRALFAIDGVASASPVVDLGDQFRKGLAPFTGILRIMEAAVLVLALLIAFNAMSVAVDERAREHATMFAFGVTPRTVIEMTVFEAAVVGLVGTLLGIGAAWLVLQWMFSSLLPETLPDVGLTAYLSWPTLLAAGLAGVAAVAVAPLLTVRRLRHMDIPSTLRMVE